MKNIIVKKHLLGITDWLRANVNYLFLLFIVFSFSLGELFRKILVLLALLGIFYVIRDRKALVARIEVKILALLFLCIWLPMLASLLDAEYINSSARAAFRYIVYFFSGIVLFKLVNKDFSIEKLNNGVLAISLFWAFDLLVQLVTGTDLFGYPKPVDVYRFTGMFYPHYHLGIVLSVLSPLLFDAIRRLAELYKWAWLLLLPILVAIMFGGSRSSWIILAFSTLFYLVYMHRAGFVIKWKSMAIKASVIVFFLAIAMQNAPEIKKRVYALPDVLSSDEQVLDTALSLRLPIWKTAVVVISQNWINGIGPRGFRYSYDSYAGKNDDWYQRNTGHPHLFILEVGAETGTIGILGYFAFLFVIVVQVWRLSNTSKNYAVPWGIAVLMAAFPLAASNSFYANFMSALIWVITVIFVSQLSADNKIAAIDKSGRQ